MARYTCPHHGTEQDSYCPQCLADYDTLPDPAGMTGDERAAELPRWGDVLTIPFEQMHARIEALVGRPVWTHEMAGQERYDLLIEEARTRPGVVDMDAITAKMPHDTPTIIVQVTP